MIIYGTKAAKGKFIQTAIQCPFCGENHAVGVLPYHKYFHLYWIPIIPYGREFITACAKCGTAVPDHYLGTNGVNEEIKKQAKRPIWTYAGLFILGMIGISIFVSILTN